MAVVKAVSYAHRYVSSRVTSGGEDIKLPSLC